MGSPAGAALKSIHVLRKPCAESTVAANVLRWGTGAISVEGTRIGVPFVSAGGNNFDAWRSGEGRTDRPPAHGIVGAIVASGRWPANLVLQHLDGCVQDGSKTVKGAGHYPAARSAGSQISGPSGHTGQVDLTERHLKEETVTAWTCVEGCPIAALDAQSGVLRPRGNVNLSTSGGGSGASYRMPSVADAHHLRYELSMSGGASRFFKQVSGMVTLSGGGRGRTS